MKVFKIKHSKTSFWARASDRYIQVIKHPKTVFSVAALMLVGLSFATTYSVLASSQSDQVAIAEYTTSAKQQDAAQEKVRYNRAQKKTEQETQRKLEQSAAAQSALTNFAAPSTVSLPVISPSGIYAYVRGSLLYVDTALQDKSVVISSQPTARWFGGWNNPADAGPLVSNAEAQGKLATIVAYNIPVRDCGSYSAGGANNSDSYRAWITQLASAIGQRKAIVVLEPDALPGMDCLAVPDQEKRLSDLSAAVTILSTQTKAAIYLDAGNYSWQSASVMTDRLKRANVANATGFSLNISGFGWTNESVTYGDKIASTLGKSYIVDTSRNGNGPAAGNEWCNPWGRALGERPTTSASSPYADAYLWVKVPGESDGTCNGGPVAGVWWQAYADELIRNARL